MLSGNLDIMVEVTPDAVGLFKEKPEFALYEQAGPHLWFLILNLKEGPFQSKQVRQAVNYASIKKPWSTTFLQGTAGVGDRADAQGVRLGVPTANFRPTPTIPTRRAG